MKITQLDVWPVLSAKAGKIKANGAVVLDDTVKLKFTLIEGPTGLFAGLPGKKGKDGKWYPEVYVLDDTLKATLNSEAVKAYEEKQSGVLPQGEAAGPENQDTTIPF